MKHKTGIAGKIYLALIILLLYVPIVVVVIFSFNDSKSSAEWAGFTLDWYRKLFSSTKYTDSLKNSLTVAALSVLGAGIIGTCAAVGSASRNFRTKGMFESIGMLPIMIPEIILGIAMLSLFTLIKIPFGLGAITLAHITFCIPYVYLTVRSRLADMDKSVIEAARDLGASKSYAFLSIMVPLLMPAIGGGCLLAFAMSFDDVIISFFLTAPGANLLPVQVYSSLKIGLTPEINALFTIMLGVILSALIIFALFSRILRKGKKKF